MVHTACLTILILLFNLASAAVVKLHAWQPLCVEEGAACGWAVGNSMQQGANVMMDRINSVGFLKGGHTLNFTVVDTHCSGIWGLKSATKLIMEPASDWPFAVMGCGCSGCTMNAQPILRTAKIPMVSQSATSPSLSDRAKYPAFFRFWPTDEAIVDAMFVLFRFFNFTTFAQVYDEAYGAGLQSHYRFRLGSYNGEMTDVMVGSPFALIDKGTPAQIGSTLQKVLGSRVRAVMLLMYDTMVRSWTCEVNKRGIRGLIQTTFGWFPNGWESEPFKDDIPCKVSEYQQALAYLIVPVSTPWADRATPVPCGPADYTTGDFADEVQRRMDLQGWGASGGEGFNADAVCFIATAWNKMFDQGYTLNDLINPNAATYDAIAATMQGISFQGVSGYVSFASDGSKDKSGDRQGSYTFDQFVNGSYTSWGTLTAGVLSLLPGKVPSFDQGFTWPTDPPPMLYPQCPSGQVFNHRSNSCVGCPKNKVFADSAGMCVCMAGFREEGEECSMCGNGTYSSSVGSLLCLQCPEGKYAPDNTAATQCEFCERGTFASSPGTAACTRCPAGKTTENIASASINNCVCDIGFYAVNDSCVQCPLNSTTLGILSPSVSSCRCSQDLYMTTTDGGGDTTDSMCVKCPSGSATSGDGKTSVFSCLCKAGTYLPLGATDACSPCIPGMTCPLGSSAAHFPSMVTSPSESTYPLSKPRHWASKEEPMSIFTCRSEYQCPGGAPEACGPNLNGKLCSDCPEEWHWTGHECVECSGIEKSPFVFPVLPILCGPIAILMLYRTSRDPVERWGSWRNGIASCIFVCLNHYQIIVLLSSATIEYPPTISNTFSFWSFVEAPLTIFKMDCAGYTSFESSMAFKSASPVVIALVFLLTFVVSYFVGFCVGRERRLDGNMMFNIFMSVIFTFFGAIASMAMSLFKCNDNPNGETTLASDLRIICGKDAWKSMLIVGIFSFLLYVVCCGGLFLYIIIIAPQKFTVPVFQRRWKFLFLKYRPDVWWWSIAFLFKNMIYNLAFVIFSNPVAQLYLAVVITCLYLGLLVCYYPFRHRVVNCVDVLACFSLILNASVLACLAYQQGDLDETDILSRFGTAISFFPIGCGVICALGLAIWSQKVEENKKHNAELIKKAAAYISSMTDDQALQFIHHLGQWDEEFLKRSASIVMSEAAGLKVFRLSDGRFHHQHSETIQQSLTHSQHSQDNKVSDEKVAEQEIPTKNADVEPVIAQPVIEETFDDLPWDSHGHPSFSPRVCLVSNTPRTPQGNRTPENLATPRTPRY